MCSEGVHLSGSRCDAGLILISSMNTDRESGAYRSIDLVRSFKQEVSEKSDHRVNWLVVAKRS